MKTKRAKGQIEMWPEIQIGAKLFVLHEYYGSDGDVRVL